MFYHSNFSSLNFWYFSFSKQNSCKMKEIAICFIKSTKKTEPIDYIIYFFSKVKIYIDSNKPSYIIFKFIFFNCSF